MNNFIVTNLQALLMGAVVLGSSIVALRGIYRYDGEDGERSTGYKTRHAKRAAIVFGVGIMLAATLAYIPAGFRGVVMSLFIVGPYLFV